MVEPVPSPSYLHAAVGVSDSIADQSGVIYGASPNNGWILKSAADSADVSAPDNSPSILHRSDRSAINVRGGRPTLFLFILGWNGVRLDSPPADIFVDSAVHVRVPLVNVNFVPVVECVAIVTGDCISSRVLGTKVRNLFGCPGFQQMCFQTRVALGSPHLASGRMRRAFETFALTLEKVARNNQVSHVGLFCMGI